MSADVSEDLITSDQRSRNGLLMVPDVFSAALSSILSSCVSQDGGGHLDPVVLARQTCRAGWIAASVLLRHRWQRSRQLEPDQEPICRSAFRTSEWEVFLTVNGRKRRRRRVAMVLTRNWSHPSARSKTPLAGERVSVATKMDDMRAPQKMMLKRLDCPLVVGFSTAHNPLAPC